MFHFVELTRYIELSRYMDKNILQALDRKFEERKDVDTYFYTNYCVYFQTFSHTFKNKMSKIYMLYTYGYFVVYFQNSYK